MVRGKVPPSVAASHSSGLTDESGRSSRKVEKSYNSSKEFNNKTKICNRTLLIATNSSTGSAIREVSKNSSNHPSLIGAQWFHMLKVGQKSIVSKLSLVENDCCYREQGIL